MIRVLLISADEHLKNLCRSLKTKRIEVVCEHIVPADMADRGKRFSLILFDFNLCAHGDIVFLSTIFAAKNHLPVLVLVNEKHVLLAAQMLNQNEADMIVVPCGADYLGACIQHYSLRKRSFFSTHPVKSIELSSFVGVSSAALLLKRQIMLASQNDMPLLLLGETGTGKSLAAKLIHELSSRKHAPFVQENTAAIQDTLIEGELFGSKAGAYTGAVNRIGLFERAGKGTLFLDEIGSISSSMQSKLLRVLETGEFRRVGDSQTKKAAVRIICATNSPLERWKDEGLFRKDLYYRITGMQLYIPPLAQRKEDILPLARFFLSRLSLKSGTNKRLTSGAQQKLGEHIWPGNIRELQNCVERAFYLSKTSSILDEDITFVL